jgi:hypothetical protein
VTIFRKFGLVGLLFWSLSLAQNGTPRVGSFMDMSLTPQSSQPALIEIHTDPALTQNGEMRFVIYRDDDDLRTFDTRVLPPVERGLYRLEYPFPESGSWVIRLRFGTGLDLYETQVSSYLDPSREKTLNFRSRFYGSLSADTPSYIQHLGFGIFALMLVIALTLVITILRWLKRQQKTVQP